MNNTQLSGLEINTAGKSRDITVPGTQEESIQNAHILMVLELDFSGLPRGNCDGISWDSYTDIIAEIFGEDLIHNPWKDAERFQSRILLDYLVSHTIWIKRSV
jgi:hypothetical protein